MNNMPEDIERVVRGYINQVVHMSLGTCVNDRPWVCEVHFAYDDELNLYFCSTQERRHSQDIARNPHVAGNIVEQHELGQKPRGVYFEGRAEMLQDITAEHPAYQIYQERLQRPGLLEDLQAEDGGRLYKITVSDFYVFDARESKPSTKYHLPWKQ